MEENRIGYYGVTIEFDRVDTAGVKHTGARRTHIGQVNSAKQAETVFLKQTQDNEPTGTNFKVIDASFISDETDSPKFNEYNQKFLK